jgi:hypothetical protein
MELLVMPLTKWQSKPGYVVLSSSVIEFDVLVPATNYADRFGLDL